MPQIGDLINVPSDWVPGAAILRKNLGNAQITTIVNNLTRRQVIQGSIGATFIGDDVIDKGSIGAIPCFTPRTIVAWEVIFLPGVTNTIVFDVWKIDYANYETVSSANSIFSFGPKPSISAANKNRSFVMTGVDTTILAGDILVFVCLTRGNPHWGQIALQTTD
jgi:hypothetical protein